MMFISLKVRESFFNARQSRQPCHLDRPRARTSLIINIFPIITITILIPTMSHWSHDHIHYFFALYLHFDWFNVVISSMLKIDSDELHQCIVFIFTSKTGVLIVFHMFRKVEFLFLFPWRRVSFRQIASKIKGWQDNLVCLRKISKIAKVIF